ncbi:MAG TPA: acyl-CoA synthetase FdrA [Candidatus Lachnoclostridium stercoravium]|uniref:Acyl-CoA synthetase FdrA n=1 Tax=Candidatus Lachnoclostridium stercoravium TaxID=2838633 RepID=A0A9D2HFE6_9FIRM|nr:acyl-CoA synthetase FdrA [Candidatus Lachnoclostridium stercoravium]
MIYTVVRKNSYQDSINLMLLTNRINTLEGVARSQIMMGTDANKDIFKNSGLYSDEVEKAAPSDMVIVVEADDEKIVDKVLEETKVFLNDLSVKKKGNDIKTAKNWDEAVDMLPDANVALFSIPGEYAAPDLEEALDRGLHVFSFTDNVSLEDEIRLKKKAHEKGLLFMGPDCGTGIISSIPVAFTNVVKPGNIGIVGASGTGIQEVTTIIDRLGGGVIHAIGTGGRDLNEKVGAITVKDAIAALDKHDPTDIIVVISKPPAKEVRDEVVQLLQNVSKPVVAIFLGEKPDHHEGNVYLAHTLEETAQIAVDLANGREVKKNYCTPAVSPIDHVLSSEKTVKGLYSGGTLAAEAGMMISEALDLGGLIKEEGYILKTNGYEVIDLGDDIYTQGKPHPMIDPEVRIRKIREYAADKDTGVILLDCVLGYGCHPDMAGCLAPVIRESMDKAKAEGRELYFVASVCGTDKDPQDYRQSVETLKASGAFVEESNAKAIRLALKLKGLDCVEEDKAVVPYTGPKFEVPEVSEQILDLLNTKPRIINIGVESFNESIVKYNGKSVQFSWKPAAGGNKEMIRIIHELNKIKEIDEYNDQVVQRLKDAQPFLIDVVPAVSVIPELNGKVLLHAGPPTITYPEMTGPMQGSCIGAMLFEGWAKDEDEAKAMLEAGEIQFIPCHHVHAVGPMGGITSANMPVMVVENRLDGTRAYCIMNEGIGKVLRFGAYSKEVVDRLTWMKDVLGPVLGAAVRKMDGGLNLNVIIAKAITMGDEFHQRNIAASLCFLKEVAPVIVSMDWDQKEKEEVISFLAKTDQFFLNVMMATGKSMADCARKIEKGCIVTAMTRNGRNFGIRISGLGDQWFTAPVNTPNGLYFTGFSEKDANPDIGDSAITETVGVGGMAMVAAPGVTRFVGAGGFEDALRVSNEMEEICISHNPNFTIPTWDFKGTPLGIDIRKVVATGITPLINTGIAHRQAGVGQVGAGTVRAPLGCFEKALEAYAKHMGI